MSLREFRLCDSPACNNPAKEACALCTLDRCAEHLGNQYIAIAVVAGGAGTPVINEFLGKCPAVAICVECRNTLVTHTTGIHIDVRKMPLSSLVEPMRDKLIEAASAFLAEQKLKKR